MPKAFSNSSIIINFFVTSLPIIPSTLNACHDTINVFYAFLNRWAFDLNTLGSKISKNTWEELRRYWIEGKATLSAFLKMILAYSDHHWSFCFIATASFQTWEAEALPVNCTRPHLWVVNQVVWLEDTYSVYFSIFGLQEAINFSKKKKWERAATFLIPTSWSYMCLCYYLNPACSGGAGLY